MARKEEKDEVEMTGFWIELQRDFGFRGAHLGKGFVMDGDVDRDWAEFICLDEGLAKRVPKPAVLPPKPWEDVPTETPLVAKHPTAPRAHGDAPRK
jgi:hypothetical protein